MSVTANQRDAACEAIERRDAAWDACIAAMIISDGTTPRAAVDSLVEAEAALARTLPL